MNLQIDEVLGLKTYFSEDILYDLENKAVSKTQNPIESAKKENIQTHETEQTAQKNKVFMTDIKYVGKASNGFVMLFKGNVFEYKKVTDTLEILCSYYKFKLSECAVIDINENSEIPLNDMLEKIHTKYLLSWGIHYDFLNEINPYQITMVNNVKVIKVDVFSQVMQSNDLKQKMNIALKTAFSS